MTENTVPEYCLGGNSQFLPESDVEVVARDTQALLKKWRVRKKRKPFRFQNVKGTFSVVVEYK